MSGIQSFCFICGVFPHPPYPHTHPCIGSSAPLLHPSPYTDRLLGFWLQGARGAKGWWGMWGLRAQGGGSGELSQLSGYFEN